ncbi:hypothetical protein HXA31_01745 [Salipaludibacillus agaradhaerens]|uniref:Uncharacterized protein n=1 Tax=Salipaludibacillus agaradhaerens TaxID=76935 RepID=A0A9Q4G024_SALAG|nr:hypothetical protein [Salipaludibacillus agaradhaerens]MCR6097428.1 hypothetical protein [Salipaludibacillus agaradhaerens]MCR6113088.1 hypothetical protein [Salipaludibacillus agaradhaerens]
MKLITTVAGNQVFILNILTNRQLEVGKGLIDRLLIPWSLQTKFMESPGWKCESTYLREGS